jgi:hypothetical protein
MKKLYTNYLKDAPWPAVVGLIVIGLSSLLLLWAAGVIIIEIIKKSI